MALSELLGKAATLAFMVAAARALGVEEFGAFAYAISFSLLVATLPAWGFDLVVVQRGSASPRELPRLLSEALTWHAAIAVPVFGAAVLAGFALRPDTPSAVALTLVLAAAMIDVFSEAARAAAAARQEQVGTSMALVVQRVAAAVIGIAALAGGAGLVGLAAAYLAASAIGLAGTWLSLRRIGLRGDLRSVSREGLARSWRVAAAMGVDGILGLTLFRVDQVILQAFHGDRAVGIYAAAYRLLETVLFVSWAVTRAVFPVMSAEPTKARAGLERAVAAIAVLYVPFAVGLLIEAEEVLRLLFGDPFAASGASAARWLAAAPLVFAVGFVGGHALLARDRRWQVVATSAAAAAANVALNLALIPALSGTGAAIATTASYAVKAGLVLWLLLPIAGMPRIHRPLAVPLTAAVPMAALLLALDLHVALEVGLAAAVYAAAWYGLAVRLAPEQPALIRSLLRR